MFDPLKPYTQLPLLPPRQLLESVELYKALVGAAEALASLSATAQSLPNQAALYQSVALLEAKASSEIEQVITTDDKLYGSIPAGEELDPMTKEVQRYASALQHGWIDERPLCPSLAEEICTIIKGQTMRVRVGPGTELKSTTQRKTIYTPPDGENLLRDLLDNLFTWVHDEKNKLHPIIKAAIGHYQFEAIHPFTDGNGRTGRIMFVLYLVEQRLLNAPVLFISGEILRYKDEYQRHLQTIHESGDFLPYLTWFVDVVRIAALKSVKRALKVKAAMQDFKTKIREIDPKMYSQDLVNVLFRGPLVFANQLVEHHVVGSVSTAHAYLKKLESKGLLVRSSRLYNRKTGYRNIRLYEALSDRD